MRRGKCQIHGPNFNRDGVETDVKVYESAALTGVVNHTNRLVLCDYCRARLRFFMKEGRICWEELAYGNS